MCAMYRNGETGIVINGVSPSALALVRNMERQRVFEKNMGRRINLLWRLLDDMGIEVKSKIITAALHAAIQEYRKR